VSGDARDLVPEYVLGVLSAEERTQVKGVLDGGDSQALNHEVRLASEAVASLTDALPSRPMTPGGRSRLLATLASPDRFLAFFPTLRQWYDLDDDQLRAVIARIDEGISFIDAPLPGVRYFDFDAGPAAVAKEAGALILASGARFPRHVHHGSERSLILEGTLVLDGRRLHAGDILDATAGSQHQFAAGPERSLVLLVIHDGFSIVPA
jgi:hypothetical protein